MILSCTLHWLSGTYDHMLRHHGVALTSPPFFNPQGGLLWFWDAQRSLPSAPAGVLCYTRRGHEWFLDSNHPPPPPPQTFSSSPPIAPSADDLSALQRLFMALQTTPTT